MILIYYNPGVNSGGTVELKDSAGCAVLILNQLTWERRQSAFTARIICNNIQNKYRLALHPLLHFRKRVGH